MRVEIVYKDNNVECKLEVGEGYVVVVDEHGTLYVHLRRSNDLVAAFAPGQWHSMRRTDLFSFVPQGQDQ